MSRSFTRNHPIVNSLIIAIFFVAVGFMIMLNFGGGMNKKDPFVDKAVKVSVLITDIQPGGASNTYLANGQFTLNGQIQTISNLSVDPGITKGSFIDLYIDPDDPSDIRKSLDSDRVNSFARTAFIIGLILMLIGVLIIVSTVRKMKKTGNMDVMNRELTFFGESPQEYGRLYDDPFSRSNNNNNTDNNNNMFL